MRPRGSHGDGSGSCQFAHPQPLLYHVWCQACTCTTTIFFIHLFVWMRLHVMQDVKLLRSACRRKMLVDLGIHGSALPVHPRLGQLSRSIAAEKAVYDSGSWWSTAMRHQDLHRTCGLLCHCLRLRAFLARTVRRVIARPA